MRREGANKHTIYNASEQVNELDSLSVTMAVAVEEICSCLPEELLECAFKYLHDDNRSFMSLSLVSKQFLYITNRIRFFATITDETILFLPRLFHRFPNLTSLNLTIVPKTVEEVNALLTLISIFPLDIKSLSLCPTRIFKPI